MPSRKQRRREAKSKRHQYEFVYLDAEGNELEEVPDELEPKREREERRNGSKPAAATKSQPTSRGRREPPVPSWNRAFKRGALLGLVVFVLFSLTAKGNYASVIPLALLYTALFIPFTFFIDRFAYRRWQARQGGQSAASTKKTASKKR